MAGDSQNFTKSLAEAVHQAERDVGREKMRDIDPPALDRAERKLAKAEDGAKLRLQRVKESAEFGYAEQHEIRDAEYTVSEAEHRLQLQIQADREARLSAS